MISMWTEMNEQEPRNVPTTNRTSIRTDPAFQTARQILQQSLADFQRMSETLGLPVMAGPNATQEMSSVFDPSNQRFILDMMGSDVRFKPDRFEVILDVRGYSPESIHVTVQDNRVEVTAVKDEESPGFKHQQTMERTYFLPQNVQADELKSDLSCDGYLVLSAPWQ